MISNAINLELLNEDRTTNRSLIQSIVDLCKAHKMLFEAYDMLQERVIHLEGILGSSAILPKTVQFQGGNYEI